MKHIVAIAALVMLAMLVPMMTKPSIPAPDEPPLQTAPQFEYVEPIPELKLEKPLEPKLKEPLPPGVECLDDCPLIDPALVEREVRNYFADVPVLAEIARCESEYRHYAADGSVLKNKQGSSATGVMQIMASVHGDAASNLGLSIRDFYGNLAYARHLYNESGTQPWLASAYCWQHTEVATVAINKTISDT